MEHSEVMYISKYIGCGGLLRVELASCSPSRLFNCCFYNDFTVKSSIERIVHNAIEKNMTAVCIHPDSVDLFVKK